MLEITITDWILAGMAAGLIGISKSGLKGIGILIVTIMALVFGSKESTGIILPLLIVGDILAVVYYRRDVQVKLLLRLLPWMMGGVIIGALIGKDLPEELFKRAMAVIIIVSVIIMWAWERRKDRPIPTQLWFAGMMGTMAGITTMIGNLAGAFANIFFLAMRLPKNQFIGTAAWLFFIVNLFKLPFHIFYWKTITLDTFWVDLKLVPLTIICFIAGVRLISLIKNDHYRKMILILTGIGALLILIS